MTSSADVPSRLSSDTHRSALAEAATGDATAATAGAGAAAAAGNRLSMGDSPILAASSTGDPHHHRAPSLGELHQELEQEQEAQVV